MVGLGSKKRAAPARKETTAKRPRMAGGTIANRWVGRGLTLPQEKKTCDIAAFTDTVIGGTPAIYLLNGIATGDDFTNRDGRRIMMTSVFLRWSMSLNGVATDGGNVRVALVYDKQANGAAPLYGDIFAANGAIDNVNLNNRSRFQILYNKILQLGPYDSTFGTFGSPSVCAHEKYIPLNLDTQYLGTGATVTAIATGALYLVYQQDVAGTSVTIFKGCTRVRFADF